jgi:hypothetical protein
MGNDQASEIGVFLNIGAIAPDTAADRDNIIRLLSQIRRDDALLACTRLNALVNGFGPQLSPFDRQARAIAWLCTEGEVAAINRFATEHGGTSRTSVFFRGQILELARWCAQYCATHPGNGESFSDPAVRSAFFRAALIASDLWGQRLFAGRLADDGADPTQQLRRALGAFRKNLEEAVEAPHAGMVLGRSRLLFAKYLRKHLADFDARFLAAAGLSFDAFCSCSAALLMYTFAEPPDGHFFRTDYVADKTAFQPQFKAFMALQGQSPERLAEAPAERPDDSAFLTLRNRPILNFADGRSAILDPVYFSENLVSQPLFRILAGPKSGEANRVFSAFGDAFEHYATDTLDAMYPTGRGLLVKRLQSQVAGKNAAGQEFKVDAILADIDSAIVFEMKAAWIREDTVLSDDPERFLAELRNKYGQSAKPGERGKGVAQLARVIGALARREWHGDGGIYRDITLVYPVLTVHDERMAASGLGKFLDAEFQQLLGHVPRGIHVHPLIIVTIADLENLTSSVENFSLREFLAAYSSAHPDRMRSVHNFMATSSFTAKIKPSRRLIAASEETMVMLRQQLFPKPDALALVAAMETS